MGMPRAIAAPRQRSESLRPLPALRAGAHQRPQGHRAASSSSPTSQAPLHWRAPRRPRVLSLTPRSMRRHGSHLARIRTGEREYAAMRAAGACTDFMRSYTGAVVTWCEVFGYETRWGSYWRQPKHEQAVWSVFPMLFSFFVYFAHYAFDWQESCYQNFIKISSENIVRIIFRILKLYFKLYSNFKKYSEFIKQVHSCNYKTMVQSSFLLGFNTVKSL
jgi:hypothetical protein